MAFRDIRPYMLMAHIQWLDDSQETPHIVVLNGPDVSFPPHLQNSPSLVFNVSSDALQGLEINDDGISFSARFNGRIFRIEAPLNAVVAVQNQAATVMVSFAQQDDTVSAQGSSEPQQLEQASNTNSDTKPHLTMVGGTNHELGESKPKRGLHLVKKPGESESMPSTT